MKDIEIALAHRPEALADADVTIRVQYSDHENRKILVVDDPARAREVAVMWSAGSALIE